MTGITFGNLVMLLAGKRKGLDMHKVIFVGGCLNERETIAAIGVLVNNPFFLQFVQDIPEARELL